MDVETEKRKGPSAVVLVVRNVDGGGRDKRVNEIRPRSSQKLGAIL